MELECTNERIGTSTKHIDVQLKYANPEQTLFSQIKLEPPPDVVDDTVLVFQNSARSNTTCHDVTDHVSKPLKIETSSTKERVARVIGPLGVIFEVRGYNNEDVHINEPIVLLSNQTKIKQEPVDNAEEREIHGHIAGLSTHAVVPAGVQLERVAGSITPPNNVERRAEDKSSESFQPWKSIDNVQPVASIKTEVENTPLGGSDSLRDMAETPDLDSKLKHESIPCGNTTPEKSNEETSLNDYSSDDTPIYSLRSLRYKKRQRSSDKTDEQTHKAKKGEKKEIHSTSTKSKKKTKSKKTSISTTGSRESKAKHSKRQVKPLTECDICGKSMKKDKLDIHMQQHKPKAERVLYDCAKCSLKFCYMASLARHMKIHQRPDYSNYTCEHCNRTFPSTSSHYRYCVRDRKQQRDDMYSCKHCGIAYAVEQSLKTHLKNYHPGVSEDREFKCNYCNEKLTSVLSLETHFATHSERDDFHFCQICLSIFSTAWALNVHMGLHKNIIRPFSCIFCGKHYGSKYSLSAHYKELHFSSPEMLCPVCAEMISRKTGGKHLSNHSRHHDFQCRVCNKRSGSQFALFYHMRQESNIIRCCQLCDERYTSCLALTEHVSKTHGSESYGFYQCMVDPERLRKLQKKPQFREAGLLETEEEIICETCGFAARSESKLKLHLLMHTFKNTFKDGPIVCKHCGILFKRLESLKRHLRIKHWGEMISPSMPCDICGRLYTSKGNLKRHLLSHQGAKPYTCEECGRSFTQKPSLNNHMLLHQGVKPHQCDLCGKRFTQKSNLKSHLKKCQANNTQIKK